jgi:hypothetical protein
MTVPNSIPVTLGFGGRQIGYATPEITANGEVWFEMEIDAADARELLDSRLQGQELSVSGRGTVVDDSTLLLSEGALNWRDPA